MASSQGIRAGRAFVELFADDTKLVRGLKLAERRLRAFGAGVRSLGTKLFAGGAALTAPFLATLDVASDLEEGLNKFNAVFGKEAAAAGQFVDQLAADVGRSAIDIRDSMSSFQAMFVGLDFDPAKARQMSEELQSLALDFASFFNLSDQEANDRFLAALSGSSEVFDKFGINIKAAALDQQFLEMGLDKSTASATEQEKVMARVAIIMESLGKQGATGDAIKTADSFTNQLKRMQASLKDAAAAIGSALIPVLTPLVAQFAEGVKWVAKVIGKNRALVVTLFKIAAGVAIAGAALIVLGTLISGVGTAFGIAASVITGVGTVLGVVGTVIGALLTPIGLASAAVVGLGAYLIIHVRNRSEGTRLARGAVSRAEGRRACRLEWHRRCPRGRRSGPRREDPLADAQARMAEGRRLPRRSLAPLQGVLPLARQRRLLRRGVAAD